MAMGKPNTSSKHITLRRRPHVLMEIQVFILEGLPAILLGVYTFFFLPDCKYLIREPHSNA